MTVPSPGARRSTEQKALAFARMVEMTASRHTELEFDVDRLREMDAAYTHLASSLRSLPAQMEPHILVPFGSLAFFPGALQHTNEVTLLLGDNCFALCSADNAAKIAEHRAASAKSHIVETQDEVESLMNRIEQLRALSQLHGLAPGEFEIRELYVEDNGGQRDATLYAPCSGGTSEAICAKSKSSGAFAPPDSALPGTSAATRAGGCACSALSNSSA